MFFCDICRPPVKRGAMDRMKNSMQQVPNAIPKVIRRTGGANSLELEKENFERGQVWAGKGSLIQRKWVWVPRAALWVGGWWWISGSSDRLLCDWLTWFLSWCYGYYLYTLFSICCGCSCVSRAAAACLWSAETQTSLLNHKRAIEM